MSHDGLSLWCGGHRHRMKASVGSESVKVILEVKVHPAEFNMTIMSETESLRIKAYCTVQFKSWIVVNFKPQKMVERVSKKCPAANFSTVLF